MDEPRPLIISDFDHTLFQTEQFKQDFLRSLGLKELKVGEFLAPEQLAAFDRTSLSVDGYLFPDAAEFLRRTTENELKLITTGDPAWQSFKLGFVPLLADRHQTILPGNKGEYIREHILPGLTGELHFVDDLEENLLPLVDSVGVNLWQILRPGSEHPKHIASTHPRIRVIDTLDKIQVENTKI
jgi:hypothetical protein